MAGRPSKYKPEYAEQALKLCLLGATDAQLGDFFGVSEKTINTWKEKQPEFLQSLKGGKREADAKVANSLYHKAIGYEMDTVKVFQYQGQPVIVPIREKFAPDTTAAIFWLKNRDKENWRDKHEMEHSGEVKGGVMAVPVALDPKSWAEAAKEHQSRITSE